MGVGDKMEWKLEITKKLEDLGNELASSIAILNLPAANYCEKRAEQVLLPDGTLQQSCLGCVAQDIKAGKRMPIEHIFNIIDYFSENHNTQFLTINGRGDPFHPILKSETLEKIAHADSKGMQSYVFTAGNNLDDHTCRALADQGVNIMISLLGNRFIDADFFRGKTYSGSEGRLQNEAVIAENLRRLMGAYSDSESQAMEGTTRIGMNYVVTTSDIEDGCKKVSTLKGAANENRVFFVCNAEFEPHPDKEVQHKLQEIVREYSDFNLSHSTSVGGQCQMGAGSSATVDYDGTLYRCPYMDSGGDGNFVQLDSQGVSKVLKQYMEDRKYVCVIRKTKK